MEKLFDGPGFPLNCPYCGQRLAYEWSQGSSHFYRCAVHQTIVLLPDGRVVRNDPNDSVIRH